MTPHWVWLTFITMTGATVGSFLNVVVYRLPEGLSVVSPPSRCPYCEHKLRFYENVPILGWLWLRGKCSQCKASISIQYPIIEAITAILFGGTYVLFYMVGGYREPLGIMGNGIVESFPLFLVWVTMLAGLLAATLIDARYFIIPLSIPWFITFVAIVALPVGVAFGYPGPEFLGDSIDYEPYLPFVGQTGALVAWGGAAGLVLANALLRLGILPDSFEGEDDDALDENGELPPLKHPRKVALKELMFVGFPLLGMLLGHDLATHGMIDQPPIDSMPWYYTLAGCVLGYLVGGGLIWMIRIFGTLGFGKEAMGLGDIHLLGAIGAVLGWHESILVCVFLAPIFGIFAYLVMWIISKAANRPGRMIPFGPYLAGGAAVLLLLSCARLDIFDMYQTYAQLLPPELAFGPDGLLVP